jgi:hypothetical protein
MKLRHKSFFTLALALCMLALGAPARRFAHSIGPPLR